MYNDTRRNKILYYSTYILHVHIIIIILYYIFRLLSTGTHSHLNLISLSSSHYRHRHRHHFLFNDILGSWRNSSLFWSYIVFNLIRIWRSTSSQHFTQGNNLSMRTFWVSKTRWCSLYVTAAATPHTCTPIPYIKMVIFIVHFVQCYSSVKATEM